MIKYFYLNINVTSPLECFFQQTDNVFSLHPWAFESFRPVGKFTDSQALLFAWKTRKYLE